MSESTNETPLISNLADRLTRQLALLPLIRRSLPTYYQALAQEKEEPLRVAALVALLDLKSIWSTQADFVIAHAHRGAVRQRAFSFFLSVHAYDLARKVSQVAEQDTGALFTARMEAELALDYSLMAERDLDLYMASGAPDHLWNAGTNAERSGGWRASVPVYLTSLLARPMDHSAPYYLLHSLNSANRPELVAKVCDAFDVAQLYKNEVAVFRASLLAESGDPKAALKLLDRTPPTSPNPILNAHVLQLRGDVLATLGSYRDAYSTFQRMNRIEPASHVDPKGFYKVVEMRDSYRFEGSQIDPQIGSHAMMVGFPRSGTTLLENALGAHPKIQTVEEPPALQRMGRWLERFAPKDGNIPPPLAAEARLAYFDELRRQGNKGNAALTIDKMPMSSADAPFFNRAMPGMRFIFSIRHPYDVVLSCFRQNFAANTAMENFRTIEDAAKLYDYTMTRWFSVHALENDPDVVYVRYEELVKSFRPTLERVLDFVGVGWDDAILDFVAAADRRQARTPSYKKVRSGLSIGVQSSRDNYKFLFETKETAVLRKWVKHFGYED